MFEKMRRVFGPISVGLIVGAISLTFILTGAFDVLGTKFGGGNFAATVNGDTIGLADFNREYQQRLEYFQSMMQGKVDQRFLKQLGLERQVLEDLVRRQLLLQQAEKLNMMVSGEELKDKIQELPYFKKDGRFDPAYYRQLLTANGMHPARFEERVREDLLRSKFVGMVRGMSRVSESEVRQEFLSEEDKRSVPYIMVGADYGRGKLDVSEKEVSDFLKSEGGLNSAKQNYEQYKFMYAKKAPKNAAKGGKPSEPRKPEYLPFEDVKGKIATELLKDRKTEEATKLTRAAAEDLYAQVKSLSAEKARGLAKSKGFELKTAPPFNRSEKGIPGMGALPDLMADAFTEPSPLVKGPKLYEARGSFVIAFAPSAHAPDLKKFDQEKDKIADALKNKKQQAILEEWIGEARQKARIKINAALAPKEKG